MTSWGAAESNRPSETGTQLDLPAVLDEGWADLSSFPTSEALRAEAFYRQIRQQDPLLLQSQSTAIRDIRLRTGFEAVDIGSFGLRLNLRSSDLDLGISCARAQWDGLTSKLLPGFRLLGEHATRFSNSRLALASEYENVQVDLSVLSPPDFEKACRMHRHIAAAMSLTERIAYTWVKHLLNRAEALDEYERWKRVPYFRFCLDFRPSRTVRTRPVD
ncbi:hypothetical protein ACIF70_37865 [Actinacidiphila glaucinigra]|uniref:hypothetical protein n=1 Tax=Actinacidiphila glaucinigra TaxID=235986 RepID=UPI0037CA0837